ERISKKGGRPGCADICPVEAITFGKRSDMLALARERISKDPGRYIDHIYGEHEVGGPPDFIYRGSLFTSWDF
ncbi:MAG: 4Fe-4S dicluster domain-containing protein, partial [Deltaproteobacteria bacterium]|nr:4Fe-4S dicluster domain-containing protein [Deltaproteobacteria bacterium]